MMGVASAVGVDTEVILAAEIPMPHGYAFRAPGNALTRAWAGLTAGGRPLLRAPCLAFVLKHPSSGVILIDTGLHPDAQRDLRRDFGRPMSLLFRGLRAQGEPFDQQLRARGIEPEDVDTVVMTHLHVDHTSGMRLLPRARFICTGAEWAAAHARLSCARGYVRHHLPARDRMSLVDFAQDGERFGPFTRSIDLLGDDSVRLLDTPGHTPGHLSVLVRLLGGGTLLAVGDAAYTLQSIREGILPMITADDRAATRTLGELRAFAEANPDAILVPSHDPDAWRGVAQRTLRHDYSRQAERYDRSRGVSHDVLDAVAQALGSAPGRRLLDVGGGTGNYANALRERGWVPTVLDASPAMRAQAQAKGLAVAAGDATALPFPDASYDAVTMISMLHQVVDWSGALTEARRALVPGGVLAIVGLFAEHLREVTWAYDLFPSMRDHAFPQRPSLAQMLAQLPGASATPVCFSDLADASIAALCAHPEAMLDPERRRQTSFFERLERDHPEELEHGLEMLRAWLEHGRRPERERAEARRRLGDAVVISWTKPDDDGS